VDGVEKVLPSGANFVTLRLGIDAAATLRLAERAASEHSVLVKEVSGRFPDCSGYLRLAVRLPSENAALAALLGCLVHKERIA
jgi:histidinol-phosphate/aromatic aminotransferase/cobyric acid decarboxylase-like protein